MLLRKKHHKLIIKIINTWKNENVISEDESQKLNNSIEILKFDWERLAKYSFWIAGISLTISIFAILLDNVIMEMLKKIFKLSPMAKSVFLSFGATILYFWGFKRKRYKPDKIFSNEFLLFVGAIITGMAITFFGIAIDTNSGHYSILILMASMVYLFIGGFFPSTPMWVLGLISLNTWFGAESEYISGGGAYFFGMNYPLRFIILGGLIILASLPIKKSKFPHLSRPTYAIGLSNLFIALWLTSIWGNYGDMSTWHVASITERFIWSILFGLVAIGTIIWGLKNDDDIARKFGITFLFINLYTKYFEYFWKVSHKAIFFALLAVSFWFIGRYSEKVFNKLKEKLLEIPDKN